MILLEIIATIKRIPITSYLASRGYQPIKTNGSECLYLSPLRTEKTPSFTVNVTKNVWNDFGQDRGDIIRLVQSMDGCDFLTAIHKLKHYEPPANPSSFFLSGLTSSLDRPSDAISAVKLHDNKVLMRYTERRGISYSNARLYLRDVYYQNMMGKRFFAVGFANDAGGYALSDANGLKRNLEPTAPTTILGEEPLVVNLLEGFFDFLSALEYYQLTKPRCTTVVLNSLTNLDKVLPMLAGCRQVNSYLDRDPPGYRAFKRLSQAGLPIIDRSAVYEGCKDFNEYWVSTANQVPLHLQSPTTRQPELDES